MKREFTPDEARAVGDTLGIDWRKVDAEQFRVGLSIELEHGRAAADANVTDDNLALTAKIALAHLNEYPDYYTRLEKLESEAEAFWSESRGKEDSVGEEPSLI
jgi:hypothetical protein